MNFAMVGSGGRCLEFTRFGFYLLVGRTWHDTRYGRFFRQEHWVWVGRFRCYDTAILRNASILSSFLFSFLFFCLLSFVFSFFFSFFFRPCLFLFYLF